MVSAEQQQAPKYPAWWDWNSDGSVVAGAFLRAGSGYTQQGERPFVVLDVDDVGQKTVWLHHKVLREEFAREVRRRPDKEIHVGERVTIRQLPKKESGAGYDYVGYRLEFGDTPPPSQPEIFGAVDEPAATNSAPAPAGSTEARGYDEDGIPF
jgi:hypothetical protein